MLRYFVVDTRNWLPGGKKVIVSPAWIKTIDWVEEKVFVEMTKEEVKSSPGFNPSEPLSRDYEIRLYEYYGKPKYWQK
jgi:hypothetical protein